jgi:hypothetical protein
VDRRQWLRVGGLCFGALFSGPGPSLARLFAAGEAAARRHRPLDRDFSVILFWADGGPSHLDTFDLKPGAPAEVRGPAGRSAPASPASTSASTSRCGSSDAVFARSRWGRRLVNGQW